MHHPAPKAIQISSSRGICLRSLGKRPLSIFPGVPDFAVLFRHGANHTAGITHGHYIGGDVLRHHAARAYHGISPNTHARGNHRMTAYPYSILNGNGQSKFQPLPSQPSPQPPATDGLPAQQPLPPLAPQSPAPGHPPGRHAQQLPPSGPAPTQEPTAAPPLAPLPPSQQQQPPSLQQESAPSTKLPPEPEPSQAAQQTLPPLPAPAQRCRAAGLQRWRA